MLKHYSGKYFTTEVDKLVYYSLLYDVNFLVIKILNESAGVHKFESFRSDSDSSSVHEGLA